MSVRPSTPNPLSTNENASHPRRHSPNLVAPPSPHPTSAVGVPPPSPRLVGASGARRPTTGLLNGASKLPTHEVEALDQWFENLQQYEVTLEEMATASVDVKFKEELSTIEQWFKVLSEAERTATLYTLLQQSTQLQIRFFVAVLQQMARSDGMNPLTASLDGQMKTKQANRNLRPPSLNLPLLGSPSTPQFNISATPGLTSALESVSLSSSGERPLGQILEQSILAQEATTNSNTTLTDEGSWANMVNTPLVPMFKKEESGTANPIRDNVSGGANTEVNRDGHNVPGMIRSARGIPGFPALSPMNPYNVNMLGAMGLSTEAQLLAVQMVMSGMAQPGREGMPQLQQQPQSQQPKPRPHPVGSNNWRAQPSARYPGSALRSSGLKSSGLKSSGLKSSGLKSASSTGSTNSLREEEVDPELLKDIPAWLRSLRLHKYTSSFDGLTWQQMVVLDESALEAKGISALGARRRLLKMFEIVRKQMFVDSPPSAVPFPPSPLPSSAFPRSATSSNNVAQSVSAVSAPPPTESIMP